MGGGGSLAPSFLRGHPLTDGDTNAGEPPKTQIGLSTETVFCVPILPAFPLGHKAARPERLRHAFRRMLRTEAWTSPVLGYGFFLVASLADRAGRPCDLASRGSLPAPAGGRDRESPGEGAAGRARRRMFWTPQDRSRPTVQGGGGGRAKAPAPNRAPAQIQWRPQTGETVQRFKEGQRTAGATQSLEVPPCAAAKGSRSPQRQLKVRRSPEGRGGLEAE